MMQRDGLGLVYNFKGEADGSGRADYFTLLAIIAIGIVADTNFMFNEYESAADTNAYTKTAIITLFRFKNRHFFFFFSHSD
jgi:hypothetical protein